MLRSLDDVQAEFAAALLDSAVGEPGSVADPEGKPTPRRFSVYRNNVAVGLINAVRATYPAVERIVGEDFFQAMALAYIRSDPPVSPVLLEYGGGFPDFVAGFEPAASLVYLADVARIEWAWMEAYHAAEADSLDPSAFSGIAESDLPMLTFSLHPSVRIVKSAYPAWSIWRMNKGDQPVTPIDLAAGGEDSLIVRPVASVEVRRLPAGGAAFLEGLASGGELAEAAERAVRSDAGFDLAANIAGLIDSRAVVGYSCNSE